ncbi:type-4 ice-structuring protein LS-12-like [Anarrhichthys ocellatus]|uniref:type-4 ice-structuring protein LS-12-like n=1 Tax=Anarrhichthys ocellatus TaxID=433405 RepID=UPI0012EDA002|nr:type-4 ice-structuring protein LS-12-like [Anarrhichthys ocellatus]
MKFSLIATIVLLALAQGSFAQDASDLKNLGQYFEDLKTKLIQDMTELIRNQDLANQAQTQIQPLVAQIQEQLKTVATNVEEHIRPLAANVQEQLKPQIESFQQQMEAIIQKMKEQTMVLGN